MANMRIVYISSSIIPSLAANSIHVMKMCQAFAKNGHEVMLIAEASKDSDNQKIKDIYSMYGVDQCFKIIENKCYVKGGKYLQPVLWAIKARNKKPDIVYCRNHFACFFASIIGLKVIFESHIPEEKSGIVKKITFNRIISSSNFIALVVISKALKTYYLKNYPKIKNKIIVAPDGADPVPDDINPISFPKKAERFLVGYVGHLYEGKGMEIIIQLLPICPWADFHIVGGKEQDINFWKQKCKFYNNVFFHGHVYHAEVPRYIKALDVVLLPNQKNVATNAGGTLNIGKWTSPLKAFEYMSCAKPIICSDLIVLREIFENRRNAILCSVDVPTEWGKALELLRDNPAIRLKLGNNAHNDFMNKYTWLARAKYLLDKISILQNLN